jgi:Ca-activated chloride channel family protein
MTLFVKTTTANADIAEGNKAYVAQDYATALQHYTTAQSQAPAQVEPAYNTANTYYRQNELDKAQQTLEPTLARAPNALAEFVHFNLGNIAFNAKQFDVAIAQYEDALRLQPNDQDAKYNLELALQQKQQQDQQQQQNQDQQNQQQNQDQQNQDQQNQDQQQNQNQQNQQDQQNQSGGQQDQQQQDQQNGQQGDQQQQQNQQDQQNGQQGDQQNQQQQNQQDQQNGQQGDPQNQQQGQQAGQPNQQQPDQRNGQAYGARQQQGLTPEQARRLLAAIGGNSKTLMEKLQLMYMASGSIPDQDW